MIIRLTFPEKVDTRLSFIEQFLISCVEISHGPNWQWHSVKARSHYELSGPLRARGIKPRD